MATAEELRLELQKRTATSITLGRFVTLLHHWTKRCAPQFDACRRKREKGSVFLYDSEATAFLLWAQQLPKSCFTIYDFPINWDERWHSTNT